MIDDIIQWWLSLDAIGTAFAVGFIAIIAFTVLFCITCIVMDEQFDAVDIEGLN